MDLGIGLGLLLVMGSAVAQNWAYVQEHAAAAAMPALTLRHPLRTVGRLVHSGPWLRGLAAEASGFGLYVGALALAPLSLVQSVAAGGIAVLAVLSARERRCRTRRRERVGVVFSLLGLAALGASLSRSTGNPDAGSLLTVGLWLAGCALVAGTAIAVAGRTGGGVPFAVAAGVLLSSGDVSMKSALQGGSHLIFLATACAGYAIGTLLLQTAYQHAQALTAAGIATLLTNALPIVAATTILGEPIPTGGLGALRVAAFVLLVLGGGALAHADPEQRAAQPPRRRRRRADTAVETG